MGGMVISPSFANASTANSDSVTSAKSVRQVWITPAIAMDSASEIRKEKRRQGELVKAIHAEITAFQTNDQAFAADPQKAQKEAMQQIVDFRQRMAEAITPEIIASANDDTNNYTARTARTADRVAEAKAAYISNLKVRTISGSNDENADIGLGYFDILFRVEQLKQLRRLYPNRQAIVSADEAAAVSFAKLPSLDTIWATRAAEREAELAAVRLPAAARTDSQFEGQFAAAFGDGVLKVHLGRAGWVVNQHPVTGIAVNRDQQAHLAVKSDDGKCYIYTVVFEQKHEGGGRYGKAYMRSAYDNEILCKNVPR